MNNDMDHNKPSAQAGIQQKDWLQLESILFGVQHSFSEDIYPDLGLDAGMNPLLADVINDKELSENMNTISGIEARFQSLIKDRLLQEIESHPPRFPWETGSEAYLTDESFTAAEAITPLWQPQLAAFNIPFKLPESVLSALMQSCFQAMQSFEPQGVKLVQAVQELFSVETLMLHQMAQWVMAAPAPSRSGQNNVLTGDFSTANEQQQVAMSMIVAKTILDRLMISLSPTVPQAELCWETTAGTIKVQASYAASGDGELGQIINLAIALPKKGGQAIWEGAEGSASASRLYAGKLRLTLVDCQLDGIYPITITLNQSEQEAITVAIALKSA